MRQLLNVFYWLVVGVLGIVTVVGVGVGMAIITVALVLGMSLCAVTAIPLAVWFWIFDSAQSIKVISDIRHALKKESPKVKEG